MSLNEIGNCKRCGDPMPKRRKDGTGLLREFCTKRCGYGRSVKITINEERGTLPAVPTSSWWLDQSPAEFYATVRARQPLLALKFGSAPVSTIGPREASLGERIRQRRQNEIERQERAVG